MTPELAAEGLARDVVRAVQQARRDAGLDVSDRISLTVTAASRSGRPPWPTSDLIVGETLATQFGSAPDLAALPASLPTVDASSATGRPCASWSRGL